MNNEPLQPGMPSQSQQPQWIQQPPAYGQTQYGQSNVPPYGQTQYGQSNVPPYAQQQYGAPPYAQPDQTNRWLMRWLMTGIAIRVVIFLIVPLMLCGGCALMILLQGAFHH